MEAYRKNLGRTAITCGGEHNSDNTYDICCIVYKIIDNVVNSFISKQDVPSGKNINNEDYWQPISLTIDYS